MKKTKLELTWPGKEQRPCLEPRILIEDPAKSFAKEAPARDLLGDADGAAAPAGTFDNMLIKGDNLLALKALEADYAGRVKCVFIDPPYNTGSAFEHYDDGIEHSLWLSLMRDRLELIHRLLAPDGSLWVTLDDNEAHYFKVMCDEVFGRRNFVADITWEKADSPKMDSRLFSSRQDHLLVYAKALEAFTVNQVSVEGEGAPSHYSKTDDQGRAYYTKPLRAMGADGTREARPSMYYGVEAPDGETVFPKNPDGSDSRWRWSPERLNKDKDRLDWVRGKNGWSLYFRIYAEDNATRPPETLWTHAFAGSNRTAKAEAKAFVTKGQPFGTPKPERLMQRILTIATNPGDLVLDSFAGSGTTGAVAQKMGRRWIMVEIGDHADTHIVPRMRKVIDGSDQGGISKGVGWQGGGGFRYYTLAPSLLQRDPYGNLVISKDYNADMLARAMCQHLGFTYAPSADEADWWQHGKSSETDFLYVTTQSLTHDALKLLSDAVGPGRTLMICARAFNGSTDAFANLTCRKIPATILTKCEWGRDDYSLNVVGDADGEAAREEEGEDA